MASTLPLHGHLHGMRSARSPSPLFDLTPQRLMRLIVDVQARRDLQERGGWSVLERSLRTDFTRGLDGSDASDLADRHAWFQTHTGDVSIPEDSKRMKTPTQDEQLARRSRCRLVVSILRHDQPTLVMWILFLSAFLPAIVDHLLGQTGDNTGESVCFLLMAVAMTAVRVATEWQRQTQLRGQYGGQEASEDTTASCVQAATVTVVRCGEPTTLPVSELRVGDVLLLNAGEIVAADGVVLPGSSVSVAESDLVGTTGVVFKGHAEDEVVLAGSRVMEAYGVGGAKLLVLCVGERTLQHQLKLNSYGEKELCEWVRGNYKPPTTTETCKVDAEAAGVEYVSLSTPRHCLEPTEDARHGWHRMKRDEDRLKRKEKRRQEKEEWRQTKEKWRQEKEIKREKRREKKRDEAKSPFHFEVLALQRKLQNVGAIAAVVLLAILIVIQVKAAEAENVIIQINSVFIIVLTVIVVTSPDGSDLAMALGMSAAMKRLKASYVLVRDLDAVETPGSMTVLCVDKTGTLTTNKIRVAHMWTASGFLHSTPSVQATGMSDQFARWIVLLAAQAGQAMPTSRLDEPREGDGGGFGKDPYDAALLQFLSDQGVDHERFLHDVTGWSTVQVQPFSNERQRKSIIMTQYHTAAATSIKQVRVVTSGAPDVVLPRCTAIMTSDGVVSLMSESQRQEVLSDVVQEHVLAGRRVVCIACRELSGDDSSVPVSSRIETDLVCLGVVAFEDPVRPSAPLAVELLRDAGVAVCLVTGDHMTTAMDAARRCGILQVGASPDLENGCAAMDASDFRALVTDRNGDIKRIEFERVWPTLRVLARASALDKYLLVKGLQLAGERVGMVGDGDNDALALQASDVGFALGANGTSICRHSSNVVLLDGNLTSIGATMAWGRVVRTRLMTYLELQVMEVSVALGVIAVGAIVRHALPFGAAQLLWMNFVMIAFVLINGFLATDSTLQPPKPTCRPLGGGLLDSHARKWIVSHFLHQLVVLSLLVSFGHSLFGPTTTASTSPQPTTRSLSTVSAEIAGSLRQTSQTAELSVAMTVAFNTFVWMQLFCHAACHTKTDPSIPSRHFFVAWLAVGVVQAVLVQCLGPWFNCVPLSGLQWVMCIASAMTTLLVDYATRRMS